jgi:hypothetical protein
MKKICILGPVDKRVLLYPLFKAVDLMGKTLVVSDDSNLKRFSDNYTNEFTVGRMDFIIADRVADVKVDDLIKDYEFIVFVTTNELIKNCDEVIYCHALNKAIATEEVIEGLEEIAHKDVLITPSVTKEKVPLKVSIDKNSMGYVWFCEEIKEFYICKDTLLAKTVANIFADTLGVSKDTLVKTLGRKE